MGFNLAALRIISAKVKVNQTTNYIDEHWDDDEKKDTRKRGFVQVA